jgi:hypothetical protein
MLPLVMLLEAQEEASQRGWRPVYARSRSCQEASSATAIAGLKTPLRCSSVKRPWIVW